MKLGKHIFFDLDKKQIKFDDNNILYNNIKIGEIKEYKINNKKNTLNIEFKFDESKLEELKRSL
jgi:paraquat-inducible protein B